MFLAAVDWLPIIAIIIGIYLVGFWFPKRLRQQKKQSYKRKDEDKEMVAQQQTRETARELMVDLHDLGQHLSANLETKISLLKELIHQADDRIKTLNELKNKQGESSVDQKDEGDTPSPQEKIVEKSRFEKLREKHNEVFDLFDQGLTEEEIAQKTKIPIGEIHLIKGLNPANNESASQEG